MSRDKAVLVAVMVGILWLALFACQSRTFHSQPQAPKAKANAEVFTLPGSSVIDTASRKRMVVSKRVVFETEPKMINESQYWGNLRRCKNYYACGGVDGLLFVSIASRLISVSLSTIEI